MGGAKLSMVVALAASVLVGGPAASAYCLLVPDPGSSVINLMSCTTDPAGGVTWEYACAEIGINPDGLPVGMTLSSFRAAVYAAANTWNAARCTGGAAPAFQFVTYPDVDAPFGFNPSSTNANLISFRSPWPSDAAHIPGAPLVSELVWNPDSEHIILFDVDLNPQGPVTYSTSGTTGAVDVQTLITQELGFMLGLGLSTDPTAVMYSGLDPTIARHDLAADDMAGFCALYPPTRGSECEADPYGGFAGSNGCGCSVWSLHGQGTSGVGAAALLAGVLFRRRRRA